MEFKWSFNGSSMDFNGILLEFISLNGFSMDLQWIFNGFSMEF